MKHSNCAHNMLQDNLFAVMPLVSSMLDSSGVFSLAILDSAGGIVYVNTALSKCIKADSAEIVGRNITAFLTGPDGELVTKFLGGTGTVPDQALLLNLVDTERIPHSIRFRIAPLEGSFLFMGEAPEDNNRSLQEELIQLNNQLSVLSRENIRKGRELAKALADLKSTQAMLVHQEKMASLGQMTAGIAHEINNPLAFVIGNEQVLKRDFDDLLSFINMIGDALPEIAALSPRIHSEIIGKAREVGLEYLAEAVPRKINSNIEGLERVKNIILDLRNFSRLDEAEFKPCDLAEGIESTLRFLGPLQQEYGVTVETDLPPLPPLLCAPGQLNQAISNIFANAIQASHPGQIVKISTRLDDTWYRIEVTDQGSGIAAEDMTRVFDPFFTTKPVGSGTGLGLSIAHQIVAAHEGRIEIDSQPGSGTTVRILLPSRIDNKDN